MKPHALARVCFALALAVTTAREAGAVFPIGGQSCRRGIAAYSRKFVQRMMRTIQKCNDKNVRYPGSCTPPAPPESIGILEGKLQSGVQRTCQTTPEAYLGAGYLNYPGPCSDLTTGDGFTLGDLKDCLQTSHESAIQSLIDIEYNTSGPLDDTTLRCQKAVAKNGGKLVAAKLKALQKCLNGPDTFATLSATCRTDAAVLARVASVESKARAAIIAKCATSASALGMCSNPACASICGTCNANCIADCTMVTHGDVVSNLDDANVDDLIDFEYPPPPSPPVCGDGKRNRPDEECDAPSDTSCPGQCGAATSPFPCLCTDRPRERVIEHEASDLDTGWTGLAHDFALVEGGGYVIDLYDCDGPGGPDTLCTVGPSCSGGSHPSCSNNAQCASLSAGTCRKELTAVGPHCRFDVQKACSCNTEATTALTTCSDPTNCPAAGDFCMQQFHTPPLPLSAGGVPVCVVNVFTEDLSGTKDLATGSMAIHLRQKSIVQMTGTPAQPCPVCGGFCKASPGDLGGRHNCTTNADCADTTSQLCVTDLLCSFGPNQGQPCRPGPPYGGPTPLFGNPSIDCPPTLSSPGILDIVFAPQSTETVSLAPSYQCNEGAFSDKTCVGGGNQGASCTTGSQCPGGTCNDQCFCPAVGGVREQPNSCDAACVGGGNDAQSCTLDSECAGGFCHLADCRPDPSAPAALQPNEGGCTATIQGRCSYSSYQSCLRNSDCAQPICSRCNGGETCRFFAKDCFINSGITRTGVASTTDPVLSAIFCIGGTGQGAVDSTAGLPGAGAIRQPSTVIDTGF